MRTCHPVTGRQPHGPSSSAPIMGPGITATGVPIAALFHSMTEAGRPVASAPTTSAAGFQHPLPESPDPPRGKCRRLDDDTSATSANQHTLSTPEHVRHTSAGETAVLQAKLQSELDRTWSLTRSCRRPVGSWKGRDRSMLRRSDQEEMHTEEIGTLEEMQKAVETNLATEIVGLKRMLGM
jgi:hypothetical protein